MGIVSLTSPRRRLVGPPADDDHHPPTAVLNSSLQDGLSPSPPLWNYLWCSLITFASAFSMSSGTRSIHVFIYVHNDNLGCCIIESFLQVSGLGTSGFAPLANFCRRKPLATLQLGDKHSTHYLFLISF